MEDTFDLKRFITAQNAVYADVLGELKSGHKQTHWMWFIFPQVAGLGHSPTAKHYAIQSRAEAEAYYAHPVLGLRLNECTRTVLDFDKSASQIFGYPDDLKFRSCMTLFEAISGHPLFAAALNRFFDGEDKATREILAGWDSSAGR
jgi:uncharacterized protein (DUF1810 family)